MRKIFYAFVFLFSITAGSSVFAEGRRVEVLFLGDNGGHKPSDRFFLCYRALGPLGINLTYTDNLDDLNESTLPRYDALMIYADYGILKPAQEKALLSFVRGGHGLVGIHCASACFGNSKEYIRMLGGKFLSHQSAIFRARILDPDNEIMHGFRGFESWDETYVHEQFNPDKKILQDRDGEPWTWIRDEGKGRVFYTASGHDERTWSKPEYQELLYRAILWTSGSEVKARLRELNIPELVYEDGHDVPNYERRNPAPKAQKPLSIEETVKHFHVPNDLSLSLVASEPDLWKTLDIKWDERGRMWTCETTDFPNQLVKQGQGHDRIRVWEDTKETGQYDKVTVFATGLSIPCSLCFYNGGVIVLTMPDTLYLKDNKGTGVADEWRVLFTGWGTGDTHFGPSHLTYGFDGWIYGSVGADSFHGTVGGENVNFNSNALYRFKPDGSKLELLGKVSNNIWGFAFDENGNIFGSTANNQSSIYLPIPKRYYDVTPGLEMGIIPGVDANKKAPYMREYIRQVDVHGGFTAASSHMFYTARSFPEWYWNRVAFINEPTAHIVYRGIAEQNGANFTIKNGWNLLASDDEWFAPVFSTVGPDGAVYVSDFCSFVMQHGPRPTKENGGYDAIMGKGGAYETELRSHDRARIWRVASKEMHLSKMFSLSKDEPAGLLEALKSDNMLWRQHAQRLIVERGKTDVVSQLKSFVLDKSVDRVGVNGGALHSLWTLFQLHEADDATISAAFTHPASGVRRAAADVVSRDQKGCAMLLGSNLLHDKDALVRLHAILALSEMPESPEAGSALFALVADSANLSDRWLADAMTIAAAKHARTFLAVTASSSNSPLLQKPIDLIPNPDFESVFEGKPAGWKQTSFSGKAEFAVDEKIAHSGSKSLRISSATGADASWQIVLKVEPDTDYVLSAWIKSDTLKRTGTGGRGALVNLQGIPVATKHLIGTEDWKHVSAAFNSNELSEVTLNLLFGGWGSCSGSAWFDDVSLIKQDQSAHLAAIVKGAAQAFAAKASAGDIAGLRTLLAAQKNSAADFIAASLKMPEALSGKASLEELARTHQILRLSTIEGMKYSTQQLVAETGRPIALEFTNPDAMQHNFVLGKPGSLQIIGTAANALANQADGYQKSFRPDVPEVLAASGLLNPHDTVIVDIPSLAPGNYPYMCTFPGHWMIMNGTLTVTADGKVNANAKPSNLSTEKEWTIEDFKNDLPRVDKQRHFDEGKALFSRLGCIQCHQLGKEGAVFGPSLNGVFKKYGNDPKNVLTQILEPSKIIEEKYRSQFLRLEDGSVVSGLVTQENDQSLTLQSGPAATLIRKIDKKSIAKRKSNATSIMPEGLLKPLNKEQVLDLLAYLLSEGDADNPVFKQQ